MIVFVAVNQSIIINYNMLQVNQLAGSSNTAWVIMLTEKRQKCNFYSGSKKKHTRGRTYTHHTMQSQDCVSDVTSLQLRIDHDSPRINKIDEVRWKLVSFNVKTWRITLHNLHQLIKHTAPFTVRKLASGYLHLIAQRQSMMTECHVNDTEITPIWWNFAHGIFL